MYSTSKLLLKKFFTFCECCDILIGELVVFSCYTRVVHSPFQTGLWMHCLRRLLLRMPLMVTSHQPHPLPRPKNLCE